MASVIAFISGKEKVGKTNIITNLAISLAARNSNVCLFDAGAMQSNNINIFTGCAASFTLENVLDGEKTIDEVTFNISSGVSMVSAGSTKNHANLNAQQLAILHSSVKTLEKKFDFILIDTIAGMDSCVFEWVVPIYYKIIVITSEPRSLTKSFDLLRQQRIKQHMFFIWVNRVGDYQESLEVFDRFEKAVKNYLKLNVNYLGYLTEDKQVGQALLQQVPVVISHPNSVISCGFSAMADVVKKRFENAKPLFMFSDVKVFDNQPKKLKEQNINAASKQEAFEFNRLIDFYNLLERQHLPEHKLKEFILTLENIYEKKYKKSMREVDSLIAMLFAGANAESIKHLYHAIADNYELQFGEKINRGIQALLKSEEFTRKKFDISLKNILTIYQKRFHERYVEKYRE